MSVTSNFQVSNPVLKMSYAGPGWSAPNPPIINAYNFRYILIYIYYPHVISKEMMLLNTGIKI
jgi:hypothetical protein